MQKEIVPALSSRAPPLAFRLTCFGVGGFGVAALVLLVVLLGLGVPIWEETPGGPGALLVDIAWLVAFAVQHSGMARLRFKRWWTRLVPEAAERCLYVAASGVVAGLLAINWQPLPGPPLWEL